MKRIDILTKALAEATGKPEAEVRRMIAMFNHSWPSPALLEDVPDDEAEKLLMESRSEKEGILNWLRQGAQRVAIDPKRVRRIEENWKDRN